MAFLALDAPARQSLHSQFAKKCDPVTDAQLAASAIYWALRLDGPIKAAASRIELLFAQAMVFRHIHLTAARKGSGEVTGVTLAAANDHLEAYFADLRALTLARHASYWVFLIQMFGPNDDSKDAVSQETTAYLPEFVLNLEHHLLKMAIDRFEPTAPNAEALKPWAMALSCHGRVWVEFRERGVPEAVLMDALWNVGPVK